MTPAPPPAPPSGAVVELEVTSLAAGGDGVGRDAGRVTFVPRTAPGDRVRARIVHRTSSFARGELVEIVEPGAARVEPPCPHFARGCGGCQWQHVARAEQLAAKQAIVAGALRKLAGLRIHAIADPCPPLGWRRRARFHVERGRAGLYELGGHRVVALDRCPQLEPALDAAYAAVAAATPPDGELALVLAHDGRIAVATERAWRGAGRLVGHAGIAGVLAGDQPHGDVVLELEPGLWGGPWDFAQASERGNAALIAQVRAALAERDAGTERSPQPRAGRPEAADQRSRERASRDAGPASRDAGPAQRDAGPAQRDAGLEERAGRGPGRLLELYAGAGNFTRALVADGWDVVASDVVTPARPPAAFHAGPVRDVLARLEGPWDAIVLDPPRTGAAEALDGILRAAPHTIVYVSCDVATLARDAARLTGYRASDAWPLDLMPQTAHVEVVMRLERG